MSVTPTSASTPTLPAATAQVAGQQTGKAHHGGHHHGSKPAATASAEPTEETSTPGKPAGTNPSTSLLDIIA